MPHGFTTHKSTRKQFFVLKAGSTAAAVLASMLLTGNSAMAVNLYWDPSGGPSATGTWGTGNSNWNSAVNGSGTFTDTTTVTDALSFSASPVTTSGTVTVSGSQNAASITLNQSNLTLAGGAFTATSGILMNSATAATITSAMTFGTGASSSVNFNGSTPQTLILSGGESGAVQVIGGNSSKALTATLQLNGSGATNYQFNQYNIGNVLAGTGGATLNTGAAISFGVGTTIGIGQGATGLLTINGGVVGNDVTTSVAIGRTSGNGRLILTSGTISIGAGKVFDIDLQDTAGGSGRVDVNGGTLSVASNLYIGIQQTSAGGSAILNITNGTVSSGTIHFGNGSSAGSGSLNVTGGSLYAGTGGLVNDGSGTFAASISLSGGTVGASANWSSTMAVALGTTNGNITLQAADAGGTSRNIALSGVLSGAGGLTKTGGGSVTLSGVNTYTGNTLVSAGSLLLSNGGESRFAIQNGSTSNGILGSGSITIDDLFRLDISGLTDASGTWDLVNVGTLTESFGTHFGLAFLGGSSFTNNNDGTYTSGNWTFDTSTGNLQLVPEPSTWAALVVGAGFFTGVRLLRKRSA